MVVIAPSEQELGDQSKKKLGRSYNFGRRLHGWFKYGEEERILGRSQYGYASYGKDIYGNARGIYGIYRIQPMLGGQVIIKQDFYIPSNPQTEPQQANRQKYADALLSWQGLTDDQKDVYNKKAKYKKYSGYNLYLSEYLLSH